MALRRQDTIFLSEDIRESVGISPFSCCSRSTPPWPPSRPTCREMAATDAPQPSYGVATTMFDGECHASRAELTVHAFFSRHPPRVPATHHGCLELIACAHLARSIFTIHPPSSCGVSAGVGEGHHLPLHACGSWRSSRITSQVPKTYEHDIQSYETLVTVRMCPSLNCLPHLMLIAPTSLPSLSLFPASSCPPPSPAGVLSAHPHDLRLLPSRRLSGGELPLDYSHDPAAAAAAAEARCAAARLSRSMRTDGVSSARQCQWRRASTLAGGRAAEGTLARAAAAVACQTVGAVAAVGRSGLLEARVVDFCVSLRPRPRAIGLSSCRVKKIIRRAYARQSAPCSEHELYMYLQYTYSAQKGPGGGMGCKRPPAAVPSAAPAACSSQHACVPTPRR